MYDPIKARVDHSERRDIETVIVDKKTLVERGHPSSATNLK
jgi:hypothetical protein